MKNRFQWVIFLYFFLSNFALATELRTNKQIIDSLFDRFVTQAIFKIKNNLSNSYKVVGQNEFDYFNNKLTDILLENNIILNQNSITSLKLQINNLEIFYSENSDFTEREILFNAQIFLIDKDGNISSLHEINTLYKDKIEKNKISYIENHNFNFTKGKNTQKNSSFFKEILEPVIIVSSAILTVVLFFSVRTK